MPCCPRIHVSYPLMARDHKGHAVREMRQVCRFYVPILTGSIFIPVLLLSFSSFLFLFDDTDQLFYCLRVS